MSGEVKKNEDKRRRLEKKIGVERNRQEKIIGAGRYRLEKKIGQGGFGITYKALDTRLNVPVAIKEFTGKGKEIEKAFEEARLSAEFYDLEGIVSSRDFFSEGGNAYIVMEYIRGSSIMKYISENGTMSGKAVLEKIRPIMISLGKIHDGGVIHRDISPDNLMIRRDGKLVLIDFGTARLVESLTGTSNPVIFKQGFSPVEQCCDFGEQGTWTDVYALCATMYFMVTGMVPENAGERFISDQIKPLGQMYGTGLTPAEANAIMKGLSVKPKDRYETISELYRAIYQVSINEGLENLEIHTEQIATRQTIGRGRTTSLREEIRELFLTKLSIGEKKNRKKKIVLSFVGVCAVVLIVFYFFGQKELYSMGDDGVDSESATVQEIEEKSKLTEMPKATETPKMTETPKATVTPKVTEKTEVTTTPRPTEKEEAAATPKATKKPKATATPKVTKKPEKTVTPKPKVTKKPKNAVTFDGSL